MIQLLLLFQAKIVVGISVFSLGDSELNTARMPPGLLPHHKASIIMFLDRVYGIGDQHTFYRLIDEAFLPDVRVATILHAVSTSSSYDDEASSSVTCACNLLPRSINSNRY